MICSGQNQCAEVKVPICGVPLSGSIKWGAYVCMKSSTLVGYTGSRGIFAGRTGRAEVSGSGFGVPNPAGVSRTGISPYRTLAECSVGIAAVRNTSFKIR